MFSETYLQYLFSMSLYNKLHELLFRTQISKFTLKSVIVYKKHDRHIKTNTVAHSFARSPRSYIFLTTVYKTITWTLGSEKQLSSKQFAWLQAQVFVLLVFFKVAFSKHIIADVMTNCQLLWANKYCFVCFQLKTAHIYIIT